MSEQAESETCHVCGGTGWIQEGWGDYHMDGIACLACELREDESLCPKCGGELTREPCGELGCDDGVVDVYEDDPLWYEPGDNEPCDECGGRGYIEWCPQCAKEQS